MELYSDGKERRLPHKVFGKISCWLRPTLGFGRRGIRVLGGPCRRLITYYIPRVSLEGSVASGIKVPRGDRVQICVCVH